jgi:hypothetical protein
VAGGLLLALGLAGCPRTSLPKLGKAARFDPSADRGRTASSALPMDHVDARIATLKNGKKAVAWAACDDGGCDARVGYLTGGSDDGEAAEVGWSVALRMPGGAATGVRIEAIRQVDMDDDGEGEVVVVYAALKNDRLLSQRLSIHDPVDLHLVTLLELETGRPDARSCTLYVVDVNGDNHRDLVTKCSDSSKPKVRTWRRARDEWR